MKRGLLAYSADATNPILIHDLVIVPKLLRLGVVEFSNDFGGRAGGAR